MNGYLVSKESKIAQIENSKSTKITENYGHLQKCKGLICIGAVWCMDHSHKQPSSHIQVMIRDSSVHNKGYPMAIYCGTVWNLCVEPCALLWILHQYVPLRYNKPILSHHWECYCIDLSTHIIRKTRLRFKRVMLYNVMLILSVDMILICCQHGHMKLHSCQNQSPRLIPSSTSYIMFQKRQFLV